MIYVPSQYTFLNENTSLIFFDSDFIIPISLESKKCDLNIHAIMRASHCKLCIEYLPMYIWKKFFEFMMEIFFFFVLNLNYCEIQISCCWSYSEIIIIEIFPFNLKKKKNLATSSFNYVAIYFSIYSLHYFETVCSKDP